MILLSAFLFIFVAWGMEDPHALKLISNDGTPFSVARHVASMRSPTLAQLLSVPTTIEAQEREIIFKNIGYKELKLIIDHLTNNDNPEDVLNNLDSILEVHSFLRAKRAEAQLSDRIDSEKTFVKFVHAAHFFELPELVKNLAIAYAQRFKNLPKAIRNSTLSQLPAYSKNMLLQECYLRYDAILSEHPPEFTCSELEEHHKIAMVYRESDDEFAIAKRRDVKGIRLVINRPGVVKLNIKNQGLTIPPDLSRLKKLKTLNLNNNRLAKPPKISCFPELIKLYIAHNRLTKPPTLLWNVRLMSLDLSNNQLKRIPDIAILTSLRCLHLSHNKLKKLPSFRRLIHLEVLTLNNNNLKRLPVLPKGLRSMDVSMNYLSAEELQHVESCAASVDFSPQKTPKEL